MPGVHHKVTCDDLKQVENLYLLKWGSYITCVSAVFCNYVFLKFIVL